MKPQHSAWEHSAHRSARCIDCHLPNDNAASHYFWKSIDGNKDVFYEFSGLREHDEIELSAHGRRVLQANCIRCHEGMVSRIDNKRACIHCHDPKDMSLKIKNEFTLGKALKDMGVDASRLSNQDMRSLVCAQCHVTYVVRKDKDMRSDLVFFPWQNSKYGKITIEDIIKKIKSDPANLEWTQAVTGFKLGFLRHAEFELLSNDSTHWKAGLACADCHMPYTRAGSKKISDHRVMSPLKKDMKACIQCHTQGKEWLMERVKAIQDRTASLQLRAGYATAAAAKLFERANAAQKSGKNIDKALYAKAREYYEEAFYRVTFIGAENSMGFHNPPETLRVLGDAAYFAGKSEGLLRQALAQAGAPAPARVDLELGKYLDGRGKKRLNFDKTVEFKDPFRNQERF